MKLSFLKSISDHNKKCDKGLMKCLVVLLNQLILNTLTFQLLDLYQGVLTLNYPLN